MESNSEHNRIAEYVSTRLGIVINHHRHKVLNDHLQRMLAMYALESLSDLYDTLRKEPDTHPMWQHIIDVVTIGETYFFRNQAHLNALNKHVLPELIEKKRSSGQRYIRIWSAGCATGEEPYSIAMLLRDLIPDIDAWSIHLLGTDLNEHFLERARAGFYRPHSFRGETPGWLQAKWFTAEDNGFQLKSEIRNMVQYAPLNLILDDFPKVANGTKDIDMIICRNVTIYFDREQTQQLVNRFHESLVNDGWLIVGHSEPQPVVYDAFKACNFENAVFYHKSKSVKVEPVAAPRKEFVPRSVAKTSTLPRTEPLIEPVPKPVPVKNAPDDAEQIMTLWEAARRAADNEEWGEAFRLLERAELSDVLQPETHYLRALMLIQMNDHDSAELSLRQALYCDPAFALAHYTLGELREKNGALAEAHRHWQHARKALSAFQPDEPLAFDNDLTVEMLNSLLDYRLDVRR